MVASPVCNSLGCRPGRRSRSGTHVARRARSCTERHREIRVSWVPGLPGSRFAWPGSPGMTAGVNLRRHEKNTFQNIDYNPTFRYIVLTLSHQGKSRERHEAGTGGGGRGMRVQRRTPPPGSRSCTVPARRYARRSGLLAACRTGGANRPGMSWPPQRWLGCPKRKQGILKR